MSKLKEIADLLNGKAYREEMSEQEEFMLKELGIVVLFGASDDLAEFYGAVYDEVGVYEGSVIYFDEEGKILNNAYDTEELNDIAKPNGLKSISVIVDYKDYPIFKYETNIPYEKFNIIEDGNVYCEGICFYFKDLVG